MNLTRFLREPLVLFLVLGVLLFGFEQYREGQGQRKIIVDHDALLTFIENQTGEYDRQAAKARYEKMAPAAKNDLVKRYVQEEALYREALARGFDREDYVLRRRLVQKVEFLAEGASKQLDEVDPDALRAFYEKHQGRYESPEKISFTHVFLKDADEPEATRLLNTLNNDKVPASESGRFGERFPYFLNYVDRERSFVASHFGESMAEQLFSMGADEQVWSGPMRSEHGIHLVLVLKRSPASVPNFDEIREAVEREYLASQQRLARDRYLDEIVKGYEVETRLAR